ncbi:MAG TPA: heme-binding domain-containing protein [Kofleriaceae bacterium]|nr:heme-binding domain-containing protein [Kofleriaceae bacterium]
MKVSVRRLVKITLVSLAWITGLFALIQAIPYGRTHGNPPVTQEPAWDSPRTRALAVRACFNCHSNETRWPWYANVAPMSWAVQLDVDNARSIINFSEWNRTFALALYAGQSVRTGNMPTLKYRMAHPEANLSDQELRELSRGLDATLGTPRAPRT